MPSCHAHPTFCVTEAEATLIREAWNTGGELSAAVELRQLFPGIDNMSRARECTKIIVGWQAIVMPPSKVARLRKGNTDAVP
jgi:hypothetical protein